MCEHEIIFFTLEYNFSFSRLAIAWWCGGEKQQFFFSFAIWYEIHSARFIQQLTSHDDYKAANALSVVSSVEWNRTKNCEKKSNFRTRMQIATSFRRSSRAHPIRRRNFSSRANVKLLYANEEKRRRKLRARVRAQGSQSNVVSRSTGRVAASWSAEFSAFNCSNRYRSVA